MPAYRVRVTTTIDYTVEADTSDEAEEHVRTWLSLAPADQQIVPLLEDLQAEDIEVLN